jgi:dehydrogenase/reductase SDR family member 1
MVPRKQGLIVNISSFGGIKYLFNVPYGIGKAAVDRMAADCGFELRKSNVAFISLYPGAVRTELIVDYRDKVDKQMEGKKVSASQKQVFLLFKTF